MQTVNSTATGNIYYSTNNIQFGVEQDNTRPYDGMMDEIAMWNRALNSTEITQLYKKPAPLS